MQTVQSLIWSKGKLVKQVVWNCFVIQIKFVCNNTACWEIPGILYCSVLHFASLLGAPQMWTSFKSSWQKSSKLTRCILITKQMCFGKRGKYSGGKNRKYFFGKRKILELWTKNEKYLSEKNPVEKNKKERLWYSQRGRSVRKFDRMIAERYIERKQKENMELFVSLLQIFILHQGITLHYN